MDSDKIYAIIQIVFCCISIILLGYYVITYLIVKCRGSTLFLSQSYIFYIFLSLMILLITQLAIPILYLTNIDLEHNKLTCQLMGYLKTTSIIIYSVSMIMFQLWICLQVALIRR